MIEEELYKVVGNLAKEIKLYNVVFDKIQNEASITFLYSENIEEITNIDREKIQNYLTNYLNLNARLNVKFKKSFLDEDLIKREVLNIIKNKFQSSFCDISEQDVNIEKDDRINILLTCNKMVSDALNNRGADKIIEQDLQKEFMAKFCCKIVNDNRSINTSIIKDRESLIISNYIDVKSTTKRYEVEDVFMLFGQDITPKPEYISSQKSERERVILSGIISNFQKKNYTKKREKQKGENAKQNAYYTFTLKDTSGFIQCTYFSSVANEQKMDKLGDGARVIAVGDLKNFNNKLTYYIRSCGICAECKNIKTKEVEKVIDVSNSDFVRPYIEKVQANLFDKKIVYSDYINDNTFVVYDFETTGLDTNKCEIIEIGAVKVENGEIKEIFQTLVKPKEPVSEEITSLTGISNEMLQDCPGIEVVLPAFYNFTRGCILGGYNSSNFDDKILGVQSRKLGLNFDNQTTDVIMLARSKVSSPNYKLGTIVKVLDIVLIGAHRALNDALATAKVLLKLNQNN